MIYLLYIAWEDGRLIWHYIHPEIPEEIIERIAGKDHSVITGFISALSMFSYELLGSRMQSVILENVKITYRYVELDGHKLIGVAITDLKDDMKLVWRIIDRFLREEKENILKMMTQISSEEYERLSLIFKSHLTKILKKAQRKIEKLAHRDARSLVYSFLVSIAVYAVMIGLVYYLNKTFSLIELGRMDELVYLILMFNFIIPGVIIGYTTGWVKGTLINSILISILTLATLSLIWWPILVNIASSMLHISPEAVIIGIFFVALILGGGMGLVASIVAWLLVESRKLVPPKLTLKG